MNIILCGYGKMGVMLEGLALESDDMQILGVVHPGLYESALDVPGKADVIIAILAPLDVRIQRAVASGFDEQDVRRRIAQQITDAERIERADVVFNNDSTKEELYNEVVNWWNEYNEA